MSKNTEAVAKLVMAATETLSTMIDEKELSRKNILQLIVKLIQAVEAFKLPGSDKKSVVLSILRTKTQAITDVDDRDAVLLLLDTIVPAAIDTIIAAASGQFAINVRGWCCS